MSFNRVSHVIVVLGALLAAGIAQGQVYPAKTIRWIVPWPPGGGADVLSRMLSPQLSEALKQQIVIDNRGGANAIIGTDIGAKAPADGYTLVFCLPASVSTNPTLYRNLPYDPVRDFAPVIQLNAIAIMLVSANALPVKSVAELKGKKIGMSPAGSATHAIATAIFDQNFNIKANDFIVAPGNEARLAQFLTQGEIDAAVIRSVRRPSRVHRYRSGRTRPWASRVQAANRSAVPSPRTPALKLHWICSPLATAQAFLIPTVACAP